MLKPRKALKGKLKEFAKDNGFESLDALKSYLNIAEKYQPNRAKKEGLKVRPPVYPSGTIVEDFYGEK